MCQICDGGCNETITILDCSNCPLLTSIPDLPNLTQLDCSNCSLLVTISALPSLTRLECYKCPLLATISALPSLTELNCSNCPLLAAIPTLPSLTRLYCSYCPRLAAIPAHPRLIYIDCHGCPWLVPSNVSKLISLQWFNRRNLKYFRFKHWVTSEEGVEWIYDPDHMGGWYLKKQAVKEMNRLLNGG